MTFVLAHRANFQRPSAIQTALIGSVFSSTDALTYNLTGTLIAGQAYALFVMTTGATIPTITPTRSGETFTPVTSGSISWGTSTVRKSQAWTFTAAASGSGTVLLTSDVTALMCIAVVVALGNVDVTAPVVAAVTSSGSSSVASATLSTFAAPANRCLAFVVERGNAASGLAADADHTEVVKVDTSTPSASALVEFSNAIGERTPSATWTGTQDWSIIALELKHSNA